MMILNSVKILKYSDNRCIRVGVASYVEKQTKRGGENVELVPQATQ